MRCRTALLCAGLSGAVLWLAGCATPESRIKKNPELFASFPEEAQQKIRAGSIDIGFTPPMVEMALGRPDRQYSRRTAEGVSRIWSYTERDLRPARQRVTGSFTVRVPGHGYRTVTDTVWVDVDQYLEYERLRIEYQDGAVVAIEEVQR